MGATQLGRRASRSLAVVLVVALACRQAPENRAVPSGATASPEARSDSVHDALLLASAKIALPPPGIAPADLPDPTSPGALLVGRYCTQCHELPSPGMHSATDWPRVTRRMWLRMDRLPASLGVIRPDEGDRNTILQYLSDNALRVSGTNLPAGPGREEFAMICSRCHALPDIANHSPRDWPTVFRRMERNMERMNVSQPSGDQATRILLYLAQAPEHK